jgi:Predicted aminoglycoside phosphotransferase
MTSLGKYADLKKYFKDIVKNVWIDAVLKDVEFINAGRINLIYKLLLENAPLQQVIIRVRVMTDERFKQDFACETWLTEILRSNNFNSSPYILMADDSKKIVPFEYSMMEVIDGHPLDERERNELFYESGKLLALIHSIGVPNYGKIDKSLVYNSLNCRNYYEEYFAGILYLLKEDNQKIASAIENVIRDHYKQELYEGMCSVLLHHDFHGRNIMIQKDGNIKIIDWESSRGGVKEIDFIKLKYLTLNKCTNLSKEAFFEGYESVGGLQFTNNFLIQELMWLVKMYLFEKAVPTNDRWYFPDSDFYKNKIFKACEKIKMWSKENDTQDKILDRKQALAIYQYI